MKPFLILQLRPEDDAADGEYRSLLRACGLAEGEVRRIRLDREDLPAAFDVADYAAVIVGGGPGCVSDPPAEKSDMDARIEGQILAIMPQITARDHPFMGCCYGLGILAHHLGGQVSKARFSEPVGPSRCEMTQAGAADPLLEGLAPAFDAFVGHKEAVQDLPPGAVHLLRSDACPFQMIRHGDNVYATQFHPEADGAEFENRIRIYANHGYFAPQDADRLIALCHAAEVTVPQDILRRFAERYR